MTDKERCGQWDRKDGVESRNSLKQLVNNDLFIELFSPTASSATGNGAVLGSYRMGCSSYLMRAIVMAMSM